MCTRVQSQPFNGLIMVHDVDISGQSADKLSTGAEDDSSSLLDLFEDDEGSPIIIRRKQHVQDNTRKEPEKRKLVRFNFSEDKFFSMLRAKREGETKSQPNAYDSKSDQPCNELTDDDLDSSNPYSLYHIVKEVEPELLHSLCSERAYPRTTKTTRKDPRVIKPKWAIDDSLTLSKLQDPQPKNKKKLINGNRKNLQGKENTKKSRAIAPKTKGKNALKIARTQSPIDFEMWEPSPKEAIQQAPTALEPSFAEGPRMSTPIVRAKPAHSIPTWSLCLSPETIAEDPRSPPPPFTMDKPGSRIICDSPPQESYMPLMDPALDPFMDQDLPSPVVPEIYCVGGSTNMETGYYSGTTTAYSQHRDPLTLDPLGLEDQELQKALLEEYKQGSRNVPKQPHDLGLKNFSSTCYVNAIMQVLFALPSFAKDLKGAPTDSDKTRAFFLRQLFLDRETGTFVESNMRKFISSLKHLDEEYNETNQQDAGEFLLRLLDDMRRALPGIVENTFEFGEAENLTCPSCHHSSMKNFPGLVIHLPIKPKSKTLHHLLTAYIEKESRDIYCGKCCHKSMEVDIKLSTLPRVLILSISRYDTQSTDKLTTEIEVPLMINMKPFMRNRPEEGSPCDYHLKAVVVHMGHSRKQGHYISYVRGADSNWRRYDDLKVEVVECPANSIEWKENAYIYFYELESN